MLTSMDNIDELYKHQYMRGVAEDCPKETLINLTLCQRLMLISLVDNANKSWQCQRS
jgi:hypothetical protein